MDLPVNSIVCGDALAVLKQWPDESIDCCVTSPPYFNLRDYQIAGQIGLEKTVEEYIENLVLVFREVRRVLKPQGTFWLNIGDSYSGGKLGRTDGVGGENGFNGGPKGGQITGQARKPVRGIPSKNLLFIPYRLAMALQADRWIVRQDIIWHKRTPMPESVKDRFTRSHEYIFMLVKQSKYYFDQEAVKEDADTSGSRTNRKYAGVGTSWDVTGRDNAQGGLAQMTVGEKRNKRDVWSLTTEVGEAGHYASFPTALAETCILAGCPRGGIVLDCFAGSCTTAVVAYNLGRDFAMIELNPEYVEMSRKRLERASDEYGLLESVKVKEKAVSENVPDLFSATEPPLPATE